MTGDEIPHGLVLGRTTPVFDQHTVPAGLLRAHEVAAGVWGRLVVASGSLDFGFDDRPDTLTVRAGEHVVIPPQRPHRVIVEGEVSFVVEFYKSP